MSTERLQTTTQNPCLHYISQLYHMFSINVLLRSDLSSVSQLVTLHKLAQSRMIIRSWFRDAPGDDNRETDSHN